MSMSAARFPIQGTITNPTIDDYRQELALMEAPGQFGRSSHRLYHIIRWRRIIRRLQWAEAARQRANPVEEEAA